MYVPMNTGDYGNQQRTSDSLEMELQAVASL